MSESNGGFVLRWGHLGVVLFVQILLVGAVYGSLKFQVESHERRLDAIEKRQEDNLIPRSEYDKRHADLQEQLKELREEIQAMERKAR